jgi:hypothetical protein
MCVLAGAVTIISFICVKEISLDRELDTDSATRLTKQWRTRGRAPNRESEPVRFGLERDIQNSDRTG